MSDPLARTRSTFLSWLATSPMAVLAACGRALIEALTTDWQAAIAIGGVVLAGNGLVTYAAVLGHEHATLSLLSYAQLPDLVLLGLSSFALQNLAWSFVVSMLVLFAIGASFTVVGVVAAILGAGASVLSRVLMANKVAVADARDDVQWIASKLCSSGPPSPVPPAALWRMMRPVVVGGAVGVALGARATGYSGGVLMALTDKLSRAGAWLVVWLDTILSRQIGGNRVVLFMAAALTLCLSYTGLAWSFSCWLTAVVNEFEQRAKAVLSGGSWSSAVFVRGPCERRLSPTQMTICYATEDKAAKPVAVIGLLQSSGYLIGERAGAGTAFVVPRSQIKATFETSEMPKNLAEICPSADAPPPPPPCEGRDCPKFTGVSVDAIGSKLRPEVDGLLRDIEGIRRSVERIDGALYRCIDGVCESRWATERTARELVDELGKLEQTVKALRPTMLVGTALPTPPGLPALLGCDASSVNAEIDGWRNALTPVAFDHDKWRLADNAAPLRASNQATLSRMAQIVHRTRADYPGAFYFLLLGEADSSGDPTYNLTLSQRRVDAVRDALLLELQKAAGRSGKLADLSEEIRLVPVGEGAEYKLEDPSHPGKRRVRLYVCRAKP